MHDRQTQASEQAQTGEREGAGACERAGTRGREGGRERLGGVLVVLDVVVVAVRVCVLCVCVCAPPRRPKQHAGAKRNQGERGKCARRRRYKREGREREVYLLARRLAVVVKGSSHVPTSTFCCRDGCCGERCGCGGVEVVLDVGEHGLALVDARHEHIARSDHRLQRQPHLLPRNVRLAHLHPPPPARARTHIRTHAHTYAPTRTHARTSTHTGGRAQEKRKGRPQRRKGRRKGDQCFCGGYIRVSLANNSAPVPPLTFGCAEEPRACASFWISNDFSSRL